MDFIIFIRILRFALVKRYDRKMDAKQQGVLCQQTEQSMWMKAKSIVSAKGCSCAGGVDL